MFVRIDRLQFTRPVNNLLDNSIKYKKSAVANVSINLRDEKNFLRVSFVDDGRGVPVDEPEKIFDIFYRTDPARSGTVKGSGLGLAIVKQIVSGMNGEIFASETAGGGLTITILLPIFEMNHDENNFTD